MASPAVAIAEAGTRLAHNAVPFASRFFDTRQAGPIRRKIQRIVRRIPIVTKFMTFFVPDELRLDPPKVDTPITLPTNDEGAHITPVYNSRARKPKGFTLG